MNFDNDPAGLSKEILRIVQSSGSSHGVKIFRVDNPHTKPVWFWEWLIGKVNKKDPEVLFLAEAFTRPEYDAHARQGGVFTSRTRTSRGATRRRSRGVPQALVHDSGRLTCGRTSS